MSATLSRDPAWAPTSAAAVGNFFLSRGWQDPACPPIDQMKLQKLVFYAHAWYLAYNDGAPLFAEDIEAWPWGPVIRPLYFQTRDYGRAPITSRLTELRLDAASPLKPHFVEADVTNQTVREFLERIWQVHKPYSGIQLSNSTHAPGEPWSIIKEQYGDLGANPIIPNELITAVYQAKLQGQSAAA